MSRDTFVEQARRAQIVAAAVDVLAEEGFKAATIARIAERAGVSKGLVLYHFADKADLMRQTLFNTFEQITSDVAEAVTPNAALPELLRDVVRTTIINWAPQTKPRRAIEQIIINAGIASTPGDATISFTERESLDAAHEKLFRAGQDAGLFRAFDTRAMAVAYQGAIDATLKYLDHHPEVDVEAHADQLADLLLAAVTA